MARHPVSDKATSSTGPHGAEDPSDWVRRFAPLVRARGPVLDLACGAGRHTRLFHALGHPVTSLDIDLLHLGDLANLAGIEPIAADLEAGPWPLTGRRFAGLVVANYLWRPLFPHLIEALEPGGVLIYETFAEGNERFGKPSNPAYLLAPGELLELAWGGLQEGGLQVVAYEHGTVARPRPAVVQRLAAVRLPVGAKGSSLVPGLSIT
jgi:SAM-dependent methyltransferase